MSGVATRLDQGIGRRAGQLGGAREPAGGGGTVAGRGVGRAGAIGVVGVRGSGRGELGGHVRGRAPVLGALEQGAEPLLVRLPRRVRLRRGEVLSPFTISTNPAVLS